MPQLVIQGQIRSDQTLLDHGITDLMVHESADGAVLYATSGPNGGLSAYRIGPDAGLTLIDYAHYQPSISSDVMDRLTLLSTADGPHLVVAGNGDGQLTAYDLDPSGMINAAGVISGITGPSSAVLALNQSGVDRLFLANGGDGAIQAYSIDGPTQIAQQFSVQDTATTYAAAVFALETVSIGGADYLLSASTTDQGVTAYRIETSGLSASGNLGATDGIGIMTPTTLATVAMGGRHFVLLGSAASDGIGQSGVITVMELGADGSLSLTDHVMDTTQTRFGLIQSLDVIEANGFTYVIAAGGDDGLTLFVLMPHGRLQMIDMVFDDFGIGLENVTDMAAFHDGDTLRLFAASQMSAGVTELSLDTSRNGSVLVAVDGGGGLNGTARDDIVLGGAGNDLLTGSFGDDILEDGAGRDTLSGGGGRDIFVLRHDGETDTITDFELGRDRFDLSDWPFLYDPAAVTILPTATGAIVTWRSETLVVETLHGISLMPADVYRSIILAPQRRPVFLEQPPSPHEELTGTAGADTLDGGDGDDTIDGMAGNDSLSGGDGDDRIYGRGGNDRLFGNSENDELWGDEGYDHIRGGSGNDLIEGGAQADNLGGDDGDDTILGQAGFDLVFGGGGNDLILGGDDADGLYGQLGNDTIDGGEGDDRIFGAHGFDLMFGGNGNDLLNGGTFADVLHGEAGDDTLFGEQGVDRLYGGDGHDRISGGFDNDTVFGDDGNDTIWGNEAADRLFGGEGADFIRGGSDDDVLEGNDGDDNLGGDDGNDVIHGGAGHDRAFGGDGHDLLAGDTGDDTLMGQFGNDTIRGDDGQDHLFGHGGFDFIRGGNQNDVIYAGGQADNLGGDAGDDTLFGEQGIDVLFGGRGNDLLFGGPDADRLYGQFDEDTLDGGFGDDHLWGSFKSDTFVFGDGHGKDTIWDFEATNAVERIDLSGVTALSGFDDYDSLAASGAVRSVTNGVLIDTGGGNSIFLSGVALNQLDNTDFIF